MGEETLIVRAKRGNKKAIEILVAQYQPMVGKIMSQFRYQRDDYEDMVQEANIGILQAIQTYTPTSKYPFAHLVSLKIQNNLFTFFMNNSIIPKKYKKNKEIIIEFVGEILEIKTQLNVDDIMVYDYVIQELISEVFKLDDFRRFLVSRKYGLFGHFPMANKTLKIEANKKFNKNYSESQIKNRLIYVVRKLRKALNLKGIKGGDIWKIKNKMFKKLSTKRQKERWNVQNCLKGTNGGMVANLAIITKHSKAKICIYH